MARPKQNHAEKPQQLASKKKLSLNEFRAWLSGVEEMQDENWTPNSGQWRTIRAKIEEVIDTPTRARFNDDEFDDQPRVVRPAGPSAFSGGGGSPMTPPPTALAVEQNLVAVPGQGESSNVRSGGLKVKTPNIDTSQQPYVAAFE